MQYSFQFSIIRELVDSRMAQTCMMQYFTCSRCRVVHTHRLSLVPRPRGRREMRPGYEACTGYLHVGTLLILCEPHTPSSHIKRCLHCL